MDYILQNDACRVIIPVITAVIQSWSSSGFSMDKHFEQQFSEEDGKQCLSLG